GSLLVPTPGVVFAALAAAPPAPPLSLAEQAQHFQRNRKLIEKLVDSGMVLALARDEDALRRVTCCSELARSLGDEMKQAAQEREGGRVAELGQHLQLLLKDGLAITLQKARRQIPPGSAELDQLIEVGETT